MLTFSQDSLHQAQQHAISTYKRGLGLVTLGKSFQKDKNIGIQERGFFIEQQGLLVQQYAREALILTEQICVYGSCSTAIYSQAVAARARAVKLYSQAVTVYTQVTQGRYKAARIRLHLPDVPSHVK